MASLTGGDSPLPVGLPVFNCYRQLKREIQALIIENEELKKLVDLMKENQELKTVIQNQAMGSEMQSPALASSRVSDRGPSSVFSPGPTAESQDFRQNSSLQWNDTIEEGMISRAPIPSGSQSSKSTLTQTTLSEGQISEARARTPDPSYRDSTDVNKRYRFIRLPSSFSFRASADSVPHGPSWDSTLSDDVFASDLTLAPQRISSPTTRSAPSSFRLPSSSSSPETQRPPDVRPKEMTRKTFKAADKALTQGATSKANVVKDHKQQTWERIVGEIAFQLDRRILSSIFPERVRLYGFTVNNIPEKIIQASTDTVSNQVDEQQCTSMTRRFLEIMNRLRTVGYDPTMHPIFTEYIVNTYGILRERPELAASESGSYNNLEFLRKVVTETVPPIIRNNTLLLLECLYQLSRDDGKPMFIW